MCVCGVHVCVHVCGVVCVWCGLYVCVVWCVCHACVCVSVCMCVCVGIHNDIWLNLQATSVYVTLKDSSPSCPSKSYKAGVVREGAFGTTGDEDTTGLTAGGGGGEARERRREERGESIQNWACNSYKS